MNDKITSSDVATVSTVVLDGHPLVGLADGSVVNDEKVVYEYEDDNFVGWHKEAA